MWESVLMIGSVFASGVWVGFVAPMLWEDWTEWRRRPRDIESVNPDDAADQQPEA